MQLCHLISLIPSLSSFDLTIQSLSLHPCITYNSVQPVIHPSTYSIAVLRPSLLLDFLICRQETEEIAQKNIAEEEKKPSERFSSFSTTKNIKSPRVGESDKNIKISPTIGDSEKNITSTIESEWGSCRSEAWHCFSSNMEVCLFCLFCFSSNMEACLFSCPSSSMPTLLTD